MGKAALEVLRMIEEGRITVEEGEKLLAAMGSEVEPVSSPPPSPSEEPTSEKVRPAPAGPPAGWQRIWIYPLIAGITLLALAGYFTDQVLDSGEKLGWLACTIPLMIFGGLVALLAWWSSQARWLHLRVRDEGKQIRLSLPLPLRPAAWLVRLARPWVPQFQETAIDELILSLAETDREESMLLVEVNEGEGEQVQIYFG